MARPEQAITNRTDDRLVLHPQKGRVSQELERYGYAEEPHLAGSRGEAIYRHPLAPALMVGDDGRLDLVAGCPDTQLLTPSRSPLMRVRWGRTLLFLALLGLTTFLGLILTALVVE